MYYLTMTDRFMSGWGPATGKTNKLVIECETSEQAEILKDHADIRPEMECVNVLQSKPYYDDNVFVSWKTWDDMGGLWKDAA